MSKIAPPWPDSPAAASLDARGSSAGGSLEGEDDPKAVAAHIHFRRLHYERMSASPLFRCWTVWVWPQRVKTEDGTSLWF